MKIFHICTIVNNEEQYQEMRDSFDRAGFDESRCRFSVFDNSKANDHEGYGTFNRVMENSQEPYIIYCHQDILLNQGHGYNDLLEIIRELDSTDATWAILGNAGAMENHEVVRRIHDPLGDDRGHESHPIKVCSLDENFLVIKTASKIQCSTELKGFHLYATDLCLHATLAKHSCYVISFFLTHLSMGRIDQSFWASREDFQKQWSQRFRFRYVQTVCTTIFLSRNTILRLLFGSHRMIKWLFSSPLRHKLLCIFSDQIYAA